MEGQHRASPQALLGTYPIFLTSQVVAGSTISWSRSEHPQAGTSNFSPLLLTNLCEWVSIASMLGCAGVHPSRYDRSRRFSKAHIG